MKIYNLCCGGIASNCYYITDDSGDFAIVIDPSVHPSERPAGDHAKLCAVLLTHTHFDHMLELNAWCEIGAPLMVSCKDVDGLSDPQMNASPLFGVYASFRSADRLLSEGDEIVFGAEALKVMETPGHTEGSCCFLSENTLFSGDTIFSNGSFGRYDLPGGSFTELAESLKRILKLDEKICIYPGHGSPTTVAHERHMHGM